MKYLMQKVGLAVLMHQALFNRSFYANPTDIRTKESFIIAKDAGGNEIGIFDNKMKGTKQKVIVPMIRILSFIDLQRCICSRPKLMQH